MNKGIKITLAIIGVIILLAVIGGIFSYFKYLGVSTDVAVLNVKAGEVQVDKGEGWITAADGMMLDLKDKVRTLGDGKALVVLYESIMVTLEPDTEVSIKSLSERDVVVKQESGSTWNKFTDLAGVSSYKVETPTTVATVRGTGFNVKVLPDESIVDVGEGVVDVAFDGDRLEFSENTRAVAKKGIKLLKDKIDPETRIKLIKNMVEDLDSMKDLRIKEIMKHKDILEQAKKQYGFTDEQMVAYLEKIDSGEVSDEELMKKTPVRVAALAKLKKMNDNIKKQRALMERLDAELDAMPLDGLAELKEKRKEVRDEIKQRIKERVADRVEVIKERRENIIKEVGENKEMGEELIQEQKIGGKVDDAKQGLQEKKEATAGVLDASQVPPDEENGEPVIVDAEQQRKEEIEKGTAVAK